MRRTLFAALMLVGSMALPASAQLHVSIGINLPSYPVLQQVPGYPVYYAPRLDSNYFFYDGLYWVYEGDNWYSSPWYNGPWDMVDRFEVPVYLLRVPVRYYRSAPVYFRSWRADAPPRWGDHWGRSWEQRRSGWDRWDRRSAPPPAPLPTYQRQYSGNRYPDRSSQVVIHERSYRYQPRDNEVRQRYEQHRANVDRGHPPGNARGWEGRDRPPGQAKGWDKENRGNEGRRNEREARANEARANEARANEARANEARANEARIEARKNDARREHDRRERENPNRGNADTNRGN
jgi:hypothetical protein